jgi:hypothetical protein
MNDVYLVAPENPIIVALHIGISAAAGTGCCQSGRAIVMQP